MFKRLTNALRSMLQGSKTVTFTELPDGVPLSKLGDYQSYLKAATKKVWASWKACDIVAQTVQGTDMNVRNRRDEIVENPPADLARILQYPNQWITAGEMYYLLVMHLKILGNAFIYKSETDLNGNRPKELYIINPKRMKIVPGTTTKIKGYVYSVNGNEVPFEPNEIMHFKRPHPDNEYWGLGDIEAGEEVFNSIINRDSWEGSFWKNGASPAGILRYEELISDQDQFDRIKAKWRKEYEGRENAGKTAIVSGKWQYNQVGLSAVEMQNLEQRKYSVQEIFMQHGVPLSVAGLENSANYATAKVQDTQFRRYTVLPMVDIIQDTFNTDFASGWGDFKMVWEVGGLIPSGDVINDFIPLFDRGGMTINELRSKAGLAPDPDNPLWEQSFINAGLLPLELAGIADQSATQQAALNIRDEFLKASLIQRNGHNVDHIRQ